MKLFFTIINHRARTRLKLSLNEFCVADSIYHLSNNPKNKRSGWCYMAQTTMGQIFGLSKQSIIEIEKRLKNKGLIEKSGQLKRTTTKWYENVILDEGIYYSNDSLKEIKCFYCDKESLDSPLEVDHFISRANGGVNSSDNLVLACASCNAEKKEMNGDEFLKLKGKLVKYPKSKETLLFNKNGNGQETLPKKSRNLTQKVKKLDSYNNSYNNNNKNKDTNSDFAKIASPKSLKRKDFTVENGTYKELTDAYQQYKGIKLSGAEFGEVKRAIKTMLYSGRTKENILDFMKFCSEICQEMKEDIKIEKKYCWLENWTILTIKRKMPEFLAGKIQKVDVDWENIPEVAKSWLK